MDRFEKIYKDYMELAEKHKEMIDFYYAIIKLSHRIMLDVMSQFRDEAKKSNKRREGFDAVLDIYEANILHSFMAHYKSLKAGVVLATYSNLRAIYEIILKIYLCVCYENIAEINARYELRFDSSINKKERIEIEKKYKGLQYLRHSFILPKLYSDTSLLVNFYHEISSMVHGRLKGSGAVFEAKEHTLLDTLRLGIGLTYANLIVLFELYEPQIKKEYREEIEKLMEGYFRYIKEGLPDFIPSVNECQGRLRIKNHADFRNFCL